eukprot:242752-Prymnesium_polylepis.1
MIRWTSSPPSGVRRRSVTPLTRGGGGAAAPSSPARPASSAVSESSHVPTSRPGLPAGPASPQAAMLPTMGGTPPTARGRSDSRPCRARPGPGTP